MQAKEGVLDILNNLLAIELTAVNQYFLQAEMCRNWGFVRLYEHLRAVSLEEMKDAQEVVRHILFLQGLPNMQRLNRIRVGQTVAEHLELDLEAEREAVQFLTTSIQHCASVGDFHTRGMLERMVESEEEHMDWLETQLEAIRQVGIEIYLAQQIS